MHNSQPWHQQEEMPDGGGHGRQEQPQEDLSPFASELWMVVNPPRTSATLDLAGQEATQLVPLLSPEYSGSRKEPVVQWKECSNPISKKNKTGLVGKFTSNDRTSSWGGSHSPMFANILTSPLDGSSSMQPGSQVGNFSFNHGRSEVYPIVTNSLTTPFDGSSSMQPGGQVENFGFNHGIIGGGTSAYPVVTNTLTAPFDGSSSMQPRGQDQNFRVNHGTSGGGTSVYPIVTNTLTAPFDGSSSMQPRAGQVGKFLFNHGASSSGTSAYPMVANTLTAPFDGSSSMQPGGQVENFGFNHGIINDGTSAYPMVTSTLTAQFDGSSSVQPRGQDGSFEFNHGTSGCGASLYLTATNTPIASSHRSSSMQPGDQDANFEANHGNITGARSSLNTPSVPLYGSSSILQQNIPVSKFGVNDGARGVVANILPTLLDGSSSVQQGNLIGNFGISDGATRDGSSLLTKVSNVQPGNYPAGNIAVNEVTSGSAGSSPHPMVTNSRTNAPTGFSDAHTRAPVPNFSATQRPLEGHHSLRFPTAASAPISSNAISNVGIQGAGSCSIAPAQGTRAPKRPTKVGKGIRGIKNFFAAIGMNVPDSTPRSTAPAASTVRSDHEIGGSSRNEGYTTGVLQMNTATRNDNIAVSKSSNWNLHGAMPHSAAAAGGNNWSSTTFTKQQTTIPHNTALNDHEGGSSSNPNSALFAMQQVAIPHNSTARNDHEDGSSGNWNITNFASQLNATPYNTGYSSTHNDRQEGGISSNLSSANIARQENAYPLNTAFGYSKMCNDNKIGATRSNKSSTNMATPYTAVPQNTAMHGTHEQDGIRTNWSSTTNEMELNAIPHTTAGGYPVMHNGQQIDAGSSYMNSINIETALNTETFAETSCWNGEFGDGDNVWDWDTADILLPNDFNMNPEQQMANPVDPYQPTNANQDNTGGSKKIKLKIMFSKREFRLEGLNKVSEGLHVAFPIRVA